MPTNGSHKGNKRSIFLRRQLTEGPNSCVQKAESQRSHSGWGRLARGVEHGLHWKKEKSGEASGSVPARHEQYALLTILSSPLLLLGPPCGCGAVSCTDFNLGV